MTIQYYVYIVIGVALLVVHRRLGAYLFSLQAWPNPMERRRALAAGHLAPEELRLRRRKQMILLVLGLAFTYFGTDRLLRHYGIWDGML